MKRGVRWLLVRIRHLPPDAALWRVQAAKPKNVKSVADFARAYRAMQKGGEE